MAETLKTWLPLALRVAAFVFVLILGVAFILVGARAALASSVTLRSTSVVKDEVIRLGDIFNGLTQNENYVLGIAPRPGQDMILNARTLMRIAIALDLPWRPRDSADQTVIRRSATLIGADDIRGAIKNGLRDQGMDGNFNLSFASPVEDIALPKENEGTIELVSLRVNPDKDRFTAELAAPSAENPIRRVSLSGQVERIVELPILNRDLRNGDVISESDIAFLEVNARDIGKDCLLRAEDLVGMTPRRMVLSGKPVRAVDIQSPKMVSRNGKVLITFQKGPMTLTAEGRALQDGARGEFVRVVNIASSRTIQGVVSGPGEILVE